MHVRSLGLPLVRSEVGGSHQRTAGTISFAGLPVALGTLLAPRELHQLSEFNSRVGLCGRRRRDRCPAFVFVARVVVARGPFGEGFCRLARVTPHEAACCDGKPTGCGAPIDP